MKKIFFLPLLFISIISNAQNKEALITLGLTQHKYGNFNNAITLFNKVLAIDSLYIPALINRGNAYFELENYPKALIDANKVLKIDPKNPIAYHNRGFIYKFQGKYNEALLEYNKAISLDKNYYMAYVNKVRTQLLLKKTEEAKTTIRNLKNDFPTQSESYLVSYVYYTVINDISGALSELDNAVNVDTKNEIALNERAMYKDEINDNKGAVEDYTKLIALNPNEAKYYYGRSSANYDLKNYAPIISDCKKAIELNDTYYAAFTMLGDVYDTYGENEKAILNYEKAINIRPDFEFAYNELSKVYYLKADYKNSVTVLNRILEKKPNSISSLEYRASSKYMLKDYNGSVEDYNKLININPKKYEYYFNKANAEFDNNKKTNACEDMKKSYSMIKDRLSTEFGLTHAFLFKNCRETFSSKILKVNDLYDEAFNAYDNRNINLCIKKYDEMIKIVPDSSYLYYNRGKFKRELEQHADAILDYKKAVLLDKKNVAAWTAMGISYVHISQIENAEKSYFQAIKEDENYSIAYYDLSLIYLDKKEYEKGIKYAELAVQKDSNYTNAYLTLGEAYILIHNKQKACYNFKRAESLGSIKAKIRLISECR